MFIASILTKPFELGLALGRHKSYDRDIIVCSRQVRMATAATAKADKAAKEKAAASAMPKMAKQPPADAQLTAKPDAAPKVLVHSLLMGQEIMHLLKDDEDVT